jgi:hypothetical protein
MKKEEIDHALEFLLAFNGRVHWLEQGYCIRFEIRRIEASPPKPHGLSYSFTLHDPKGVRILGFDNAHSVRPKGSRHARKPTAADHWHRGEGDEGRPYKFESADKLLADFFAEVRRILAERGIPEDVVEVTDEGNEP